MIRLWPVSLKGRLAPPYPTGHATGDGKHEEDFVDEENNPIYDLLPIAAEHLKNENLFMIISDTHKVV